MDIEWARDGDDGQLYTLFKHDLKPFRANKTGGKWSVLF